MDVQAAVQWGTFVLLSWSVTGLQSAASCSIIILPETMAHGGSFVTI